MATRPLDDLSPRGGRGGAAARADRTVVKMRRRSRSMDPGMRFEEDGSAAEQGSPGGGPSPRQGPTFVRGGATSPRSHTTMKRGGPSGGPGSLGPRPQPSVPANGNTPAPIPRSDRNGSAPPSRGTAPAPQPRTPPSMTTPTTTAATMIAAPSKAIDPSDKKGMIINEIITTERDYVRDMEMVINVSTFLLFQAPPTKQTQTQKQKQKPRYFIYL